jgi:pyruvate/2-oxoglutarate dehydrogenase complex dihydrolipoamide acyltransferase (E2) component
MAAKKKVSKEFTPQDDAVADGEHINFDALDEQNEAARLAGAVHGSPILPQPSTTPNPYLSQEDQGMEMVAQVVGPPAYGSPDPVTSAGKLVPLTQHPLNAAALPEGHPAAIDESYGEGYGRTLVAGVPQRTDLERHLVGDRTVEGNQEIDATDSARELANEHGVDLNEVEGSGKDGRVTQDDVKQFLADQEAPSDDDDDES